MSKATGLLITIEAELKKLSILTGKEVGQIKKGSIELSTRDKRVSSIGSNKISVIRTITISIHYPDNIRDKRKEIIDDQDKIIGKLSGMDGLIFESSKGDEDQSIIIFTFNDRIEKEI